MSSVGGKAPRIRIPKIQTSGDEGLWKSWKGIPVKEKLCLLVGDDVFEAEVIEL
jgi:hypothetical protein